VLAKKRRPFHPSKQASILSAQQHLIITNICPHHKYQQYQAG